MVLFDLKKLNACLPVPSVPKSSVNILVVGASNDFIVVSVKIDYFVHEKSLLSGSMFLK